MNAPQIDPAVFRDPLEVADHEDNDISLLDLLQALAENLRLLVLGPLAAGLLALGAAFTIPPTFTARTQFLPPQQQQSAAASLLANLGSLGALAGGGIKSPADQYVSYLKSVAVQDALITRFDLLERFEVKTRTDARQALASSVRIRSGKDGLIAVEVDARDPKAAADLANAHVEELGKLLSRLSVTEAQQRRAFFEKHLAQARDGLVRAEQALKATGVTGAALKSNPGAAVAGIAALKAQVAAQEVKLGAMRGYLAESAPDFKQALAELAALRSQLAKQERDEPASANGRTDDYVSRFRDVKYHETLFELFARQYEVARVDEAREGALIQVVDAAQAPERKSAPRKAVIAMAATLATFMALVLFVLARSAWAKASQDAKASAQLEQIRQSARRALFLPAKTRRSYG